MTLTELRYLVALDKERHFGRAAERAFVSQPTLSVAVRKLEAELGIAIFERNRGEAAVTPVGRRLIDQAYRVLSEVDTLSAIAASGKDELQGPLRLGVIYTVGPYLLPHLIPTLRTQVPNMPLVIEENFTRNLSQQLRANELDAIIVALPFSQPGLLGWPLYDEPFVVVLPQGHPWEKQTAIEANDLSSEELLLLGPGHCFRDQVLAACPDCNETDPDQQPRAGSSLETIRHMVASGLGITVLPQSSIDDRNRDEQPLLTTRPFAGNGPTRRVALVWRRSFPRPRAIAALRQAIVDCELGGVTLLRSAPPVDANDAAVDIDSITL
ncbi:LysR substrate-binding domain-containing protein [Salinisphaera sp. P385]|uniref:LysR substrate-binding domain-containing protein n=1 Tax=Spectribacter acetivorans TaxID=3075603 RepID=A0ABU3B8W3_9GAMM|nr:LysR substrate-binding domain-containing protein [Salinisphaera sp. P385]MDT0618911.1 LysR substrate-binding domain-containing protein [Salinisphaera sp. P385]